MEGANIRSWCFAIRLCCLAQFLVSQLLQATSEVGGDKNQIKGIWSSIKDTDKFCIDFAKDPNLVATTVDVVVATTVIGAGFSIARHFEAFHAFFLADILSFNDEAQFIQRLRFLIDSLPSVRAICL
jgi:hypothetical protein